MTAGKGEQVHQLTALQRTTKMQCSIDLKYLLCFSWSCHVLDATNAVLPLVMRA